jgi:hypothetical protein
MCTKERRQRAYEAGEFSTRGTRSDLIELAESCDDIARITPRGSHLHVLASALAQIARHLGEGQQLDYLSNVMRYRVIERSLRSPTDDY